MAPREHIIEVTISEGKLSASHVVARGDTVTWRFVGDATGLTVHAKGSAVPFENSRVRIPDNTGAMFEYEIRQNGNPPPLPWANGTNGGCFKPIDPPT